jgi:hypothetical protein
MSNPLSAPLRNALLALCALLLAFGVACKGGGSGGGGGGNGGGGVVCGGGGGAGGIGATPLIVPATFSDWTNRGPTGIEASGVLGRWNYRLDGAISPIAAIKRDGTYYLYYIGADGNRSSDGGPRHRALGVATSCDGLSYTPHPSNPIVEYLPNNNDEEGVFSGAVVLDDGGATVLYFGALEANSPTATTVNADARRLSSSNGIDFPAGTSAPIVLNHDDSGVWNFGDELYPIGVYRSGSMYHLYYTSQGNVVKWGLGLASGSTSSFGPTQELIDPSGNSANQIIGGGAVVLDTADHFLLFLLRDFGDRVLEVREVPTSDPADIGSPIESYTGFPNVQHFTVLRDDSTWFLYVAELSYIRVYTAPVQRM